jgi:hypothetical protein
LNFQVKTGQSFIEKKTSLKQKEKKSTEIRVQVGILLENRSGNFGTV